MIGKDLRKIIWKLLMFCILTKKKELCPVYVSKINADCEKQINLLMIPNEEKRMLALSCSRKTNGYIKRNNLKKKIQIFIV